ncbi:MAG: hypothetical protein IJQ59_09510 [Bacteroidaceae bacterium]|nr:hypothetical protein [Bacteroidaceae bacterium]
MKSKTTARPYHHFTEEEKQFIRRHYARARTCCIAHLLGLKTEQVEKYVERHAGEQWACKSREKLRKINTDNSHKRKKANK